MIKLLNSSKASICFLGPNKLAKNLTLKALLYSSLLLSLPSQATELFPNTYTNTFKSVPQTFMLSWPELGEAKNSDPKGFYHFRGNPSRSLYGVGPFPQTKPRAIWRKGPYRSHYKAAITETTLAAGWKIWTGTGWTGQPVMRTLDDGREEVIVGAYDRAIHFFNADSGEQTRQKFQTGGIIKGTVSLDPSGAPLLYAGPTDGFFRIINIQDDEPFLLHRENAANATNGRHKYAWDSSPLIIGDYVFMGGENSLLYIFKVEKINDQNGRLIETKVTKINTVEGWTNKVIQEFRARKNGQTVARTSIENSPVIYGDRIYFSNSSGLVQGHDINVLINGGTREQSLVFEHWVGDDVDSTMVVDESGYLYVAVEDEVSTTEAQKLAARTNGHLVKLNPYDPINPIVWSFTIPEHQKWKTDGFWATPSINKTHIYISAHNGRLYVLDRNNGEILSDKKIRRGEEHSWSSSVLIGDQLLVPTCTPGGMILYDVSSPSNPQKIWDYKLPSGGCVESTPLVWKGSIYVGSRDGYFYKFKN